MKKLLIFIWEVAKIIIIAAVIVVPIRYFIFQPFFVRGESMEPNFQQGDYLIIDEISYQFRGPERGEVIVFDAPKSPSQRYIKRIVGLPGETVKIQDGQVNIVKKDGTAQALDESYYLPDFFQTLGQTQITLGPEEYFVLGDNRSVSSDSRSWGPLSEENIIGRVLVRVWPFAAVAKIEIPIY